jgi:hypothetical protein
VLLIVLWLILFAVIQTGLVSWRATYPLEPTPDYILQFQHLVHQWNIAALEVAIAVAALLGLGGAWRRRKRRVA